MEKAKRFELMMKAVMIFQICACGLVTVFGISGVITAAAAGMMSASCCFTISLYAFSNEAIKALKQEIESLKSGSSES